MNEYIQTVELFTVNTIFLQPLFTKCRYPWDVLQNLEEYANELIHSGIKGFRLLREGVLIGDETEIHESAVIIPPAIIGGGTVLRTGAFIRGPVIIGEGCVIGNSTEVKHSILLDKVQVPHYNYVGDSVLGNHTHLGAGVICSNLKSDKSNVVIHAETDIDTRQKKLGAIIADHAEIGCGCVLNPGVVIGIRTVVYPLTSVRGVYPANTIVKSSELSVKRENIGK